MHLASDVLFDVGNCSTKNSLFFIKVLIQFLRASKLKPGTLKDNFGLSPIVARAQISRVDTFGEIRCALESCKYGTWRHPLVALVAAPNA